MKGKKLRIKDGDNKVPKNGSQNPTQNKEKLIRIPRPLGLTLRAKQLHMEGDTDSMIKLKHILIEQWTNNGMVLNNQLYTPEQLSAYLNMPILYITKYMMKSLKNMGKVMDMNKVEENARAIFGLCLKKGLEIQAQCQAQVGCLVAQQGGEYVPFLTPALNQALANLNATQLPMLSLLKTMTDKAPVNILLQNMPTAIITGDAQAKYLTTDEALKLITPGRPSMHQDISLAHDYISHIPNLPSVDARTQDLREIGLRYDGTQSLSSGAEIEQSGHEDRIRNQGIKDTNSGLSG